MQEVILIVGPRASGKSSFCERTVAIDSSIVLVSRDIMLVEVFGKTSLDPYSGGHEYVSERMWKVVEDQLRSISPLRMILDTWNESSGERCRIIAQLRDLGAERIIAWYFVTPVEYVEKWFWKKPGIAKTEEMSTRQNQGLTFYLSDAPRRDHELFHQMASEIASDGFDQILRINPLTIGPEQVLRSQRGGDD